MALKQHLSQKLEQRLSPQQIQLMKLLQVPTMELDQRIKQEIEENPALEEGNEESDDEFDAQDVPALLAAVARRLRQFAEQLGNRRLWFGLLLTVILGNAEVLSDALAAQPCQQLR